MRDWNEGGLWPALFDPLGTAAGLQRAERSVRWAHERWRILETKRILKSSQRPSLFENAQEECQSHATDHIMSMNIWVLFCAQPKQELECIENGGVPSMRQRPRFRLAVGCWGWKMSHGLSTRIGRPVWGAVFVFFFGLWACTSCKQWVVLTVLCIHYALHFSPASFHLWFLLRPPTTTFLFNPLLTLFLSRRAVRWTSTIQPERNPSWW